MSDSTAPAARVKCVDCGLLGARNYNAGQLDEIPEKVRRVWEPNPNFWDRHDGRVVCLAGALPESDRLQEGPGNKRTLEVINESRVCGSFAAYRETLTPKEHAEMIDLQEERKRREDSRKEDQAFQERILEKELAFQERVQEGNRAFQQGLLEKLVSWQNRQRNEDAARQKEQGRAARAWNLKMVLLAAACGIIGTILGAWLRGGLK